MEQPLGEGPYKKPPPGGTLGQQSQTVFFESVKPVPKVLKVFFNVWAPALQLKEKHLTFGFFLF